METHDHAQRMENSLFILRIGNGALFRHANTKLEAIASGTEQAYSCAVFLRHGCHNPITYVYFSKILSYAFGLLSPSRPFMVLGQHLGVRGSAYAGVLLSEEK